MTDKQFRDIHEEIIEQYPIEVRIELRIARERWLGTNKRLGIKSCTDCWPVEEVE